MSAVDQGVPRKAQFCPFFIANSGHCPNGDQCPLLHDRNMINSVNPAAAHVAAVGMRMKTRPPFIGRSTPPFAEVSNDHLVAATPSADANNGDQYFNATFQPMFPGVKTSRPSPIVAAPYSDAQPPPQVMAPPRFMGPHPSQTSISMPHPQAPQPGVPKMQVDQQQNMINSFNNMSLARELEHYKGVNPGANEFVPKTMPAGVSSPASGTLSHSSSTPSFATMPGVQQQNNLHHPMLPLSAGTSPVHSPGLSPSHSPRMARRQPENPSPSTTAETAAQNVNQSNGSTIQENVGGTTYFYTSAELAQQLQGVVPPAMSLYPGIPPHIAHMKPKSNTVSFGASDDVKLSLLNKQAVSLLQLDPAQNLDIPPSVDDYEHLFPLEAPHASAHHKSPTIGYPSTCYRATGTKDGMLYCLRRVHGFRLTSTKCMQVIDVWKKVQHSNICQLREVFTTKGFGDHSIVFVYDYHPTVTTMMAQHFTQQGRMNGVTNQQFGQMDRTNARLFSGKGGWPYKSAKCLNDGGSANVGGVFTVFRNRQLPKYTNLLPECLIWHYIIQLTSALRTIHAAGLAFRVMDPTKIVLTNKYRLWLSCCGILDVLGFDATQNNPLAMMPHYQQEDMLSLGKLVLALACNSIHAVQRDMIQASVDFIARNYSTDLKNLILYLLSNHNRPRNVNDIMPMIGARFYAQLDATQQVNDILENELAKELENSRLFRLVTKLGIVNDRAEFNLDPSWSETGDRYLLKLFRDYLFHQVDENGAPWLDMAHMVHTLNKLDAGSPEKICLMSRDQSTVLLVTYAEVKVCLDSAINQLQQASAASATSQIALA